MINVRFVGWPVEPKNLAIDTPGESLVDDVIDSAKSGLYNGSGRILAVKLVGKKGSAFVEIFTLPNLI